MTLNIVPFVLCLLFIYRCIYGFWTLYGKFMVELQTGYWILFCKILLQSYIVVAIHSLTMCTLYSLHTGKDATKTPSHLLPAAKNVSIMTQKEWRGLAPNVVKCNVGKVRTGCCLYALM